MSGYKFATYTKITAVLSREKFNNLLCIWECISSGNARSEVGNSVNCGSGDICVYENGPQESDRMRPRVGGTSFTILQHFNCLHCYGNSGLSPDTSE
jgi:hypothetical protein